MANLFNDIKSGAQKEAGSLVNNAKDLLNSAVNQVENLLGIGKGAADAAKGAAAGAMGQAKGAADAAKGAAAGAMGQAKGAADAAKGLFSKTPKLVDTPKIEARELPTPQKYVKKKTSTLVTANGGNFKIQGADVKAAKAAGTLTPEKESAIKTAKDSSNRFMKKQKDGTSRWIYPYASAPLGYIYGDGTNVSKED
jgi:hypothetical protein